MENSFSLWPYLPYPVLVKIFRHLTLHDLISASEVCRFWFDASRDESVWKSLFSNHYLAGNYTTLIGDINWYQKYKRLNFHLPMFETEVLLEHKDCVMHAVFSHDGKWFVTCSKDCTVLMWNVGYPATLLHSTNMKSFSWKITHYSEFNETDTLLLVAGAHFGQYSNSGEIAIFRTNENEFQLQCRIVNKPFDILGTWYNNQYFLSGDLHWLAHSISSSFVWINKASQESASEHIPIMHNSFRFYNSNSNNCRGIMIANCSINTGKKINKDCSCIDSEDTEEAPKCLIFLTGIKSCCPHQVALKRIEPYTFPRRLDPGPSLKERLEIQQHRNELRRASTPPPEPNWNDFPSVADRFDTPDHVFDFDGFVVGVGLSPDHKYLFVNSRPWIRDNSGAFVIDPFRLSQEVNIHIFSLESLKQIGQVLKFEINCNWVNRWLHLFMDATNDFLASGSEDGFGYLWDRHYRICLLKYPHLGPVSSVAINPTNPEMLITTSYDHTIKIWRSKNATRKLGFDERVMKKAKCDFCIILLNKRKIICAEYYSKYKLFQ